MRLTFIRNKQTILTINVDGCLVRLASLARLKTIYDVDAVEISNGG